ncbi:undecaprenyl-diphosphate phosphatase [Desulfococcaceae bacterium OttesenSCG-928-F15]|nr:undecaprenyl-diphosphate phosphatase [Desulfococcaceae bacterium OttesenSCG-928-F15]
MGVSEIIFLAILQGITEFLPISSSAHLILPSELFGWKDQGMAFDIAVHTGTLLATILYFKKDLAALFMGWLATFSEKPTIETKLSWFLILATIPTGIAGILFAGFIETHLRSISVIAATTLIFGALLWYADAKGKLVGKMENLSLKQALAIGFAQALSLVPGTSRSGITLTTGLLLGLNRESAARFSFLLSIPLMILVSAYQGYKFIRTPEVYDLYAIFLGLGISFVSALLCIHFFMRWIQNSTLFPFIVYRLALGFGLLFFILFRSFS